MTEPFELVVGEWCCCAPNRRVRFVDLAAGEISCRADGETGKASVAYHPIQPHAFYAHRRMPTMLGPTKYMTLLRAALAVTS